METRYKGLLGLAVLALVAAVAIPAENNGIEWQVFVKAYDGSVIYQVVGPDGVLTDKATKVTSSIGAVTEIDDGPDWVKVVLNGQDKDGSKAGVLIKKNGQTVLDKKIDVPWEEDSGSVTVTL